MKTPKFHACVVNSEIQSGEGLHSIYRSHRTLLTLVRIFTVSRPDRVRVTATSSLFPLTSAGFSWLD